MACYVLPRKPPGVPVTASHPVFLNSGMWTQTEAPRAAFLLKNEVFGELKGACQFSDQFITLKNESVPCDILDVPVGTKTGQPQLRAVPVVVGHSHGYLPPAGSVTSVSVHCRLLGPDSRPVSWPISRVASVWPAEVHALGSMGSMGLCENTLVPPAEAVRVSSECLVAPNGEAGEETILSDLWDLFILNL